MTKRERELLKRVADLEERIRVLESVPSQRTVYEHHYHYAQPVPYYRAPTYPSLQQLWWTTAGSSFQATTTTITDSPNFPHTLTL